MSDQGEKNEGLARFCRVFHSNVDVRDLCEHFTEELHQFTSSSRVRLFALSGEQVSRFYPAVVHLPSASLNPSAIQWVMEHRQSRVVMLHEMIDPPPGAGDFAEEEHQAFLYIPVVGRGDVLGVLELSSREVSHLQEWDQRFLELVCGLFGLALDGLMGRGRIGELEQSQRETAYLREEIKADRGLRLLTGESPGMKKARQAILQVARAESTVLILGETGTGKELVARAIHQLSARRDHLLVTVNCAALAPGVIASELFGHEPGAFTGAVKRRLGRFELANRGSIFLDEVGELPAETQVMLLRVLQERSIERVGSNQLIPVDVRVIAATHRDLAVAMTEGRFRSDLFFRLNVFPIHVPPLRDRREDIPDLVSHFLQHLGRRLNKSVTRMSVDSLKLLMDYDWPGNVRELENLMERALVVADGDTLTVDPNWLGPPRRPEPGNAPSTELAEVERHAILDALDRCDGRIYGPGGAASILGLKPTTLYGKMRKHGISRPPISPGMKKGP